MYQLLAVLIGVIITVMVTANGELSRYVGGYSSLLIIHIVGLIAAIVILIIKRERFRLKKDLPIYLFSAGSIGVAVVFFNNGCFNYLGASLTLSLGIFGQLLISSFIDHFGLFGMKTYKFNNKKIVGFLIIFAGLITMILY